MRAEWLALWLLAAGPAGAESAAVNYMLECQGCHLADGSGSASAVPDLRGSIGRFLGAPGGRAYLVQVPGSAQSRLSDADLAAVLNWMLRRFGPEDAVRHLPPYSAAEVARYRASPLVEVAARRAELMRALAEPAGEPEGAYREEPAAPDS